MNKRTIFGASSIAAAGIVAGCLMSVAGTANAADTNASATTATSSASSTAAPLTAPTFGGGSDGNGGADGHGPDGKGGPGGGTPVTGDLKTTLSDLATAKVEGATIDDVIKHTDGTYDVHMTKADGTTHVSVEIDANQNVTDVHEMTGPASGHGPDGKGGPGFGGPGGGTPVTGDLKTTLSDLATAKVAGATIDDVIKHADGTYDVHMTKADGTTHVSVEIDANLSITDVHEMTRPAGAPSDATAPTATATPSTN